MAEKQAKFDMAKGDIDAFQNYFLPYEAGREVHILEEDVLIRDRNGNVVGELRKGFAVRDPSMSDLRGGDIGDNDKFVIIFDLPDATATKSFGLVNELSSDGYSASKKAGKDQ